MATEERDRAGHDGAAGGPARDAAEGPAGHDSAAYEPEPLSDLERGTVQRAQLRTRVADIAWTALVVVLAAWVLWSAIGVARAEANAWVYCAIGAVLFAVALWARLSTLRARARTRL
ncbi:hypothetical protein [Streptomyces niveus]|uniref:hypothetical protein n=1 Tax=Streptomyces niveus TaxID=193462 RepID=UPI00341C45F0